MGSTGNKPPVRNAIWILLIVAAIAGTCTATRSEAQETVVSLGQPLIGSSVCSFTSLGVSREFFDRRMLAGMVAQGSGDCHGEQVDANITGYVMALMPVHRRVDIGFGIGLREHGDIGIGHELSALPPRREERLQLVAGILIRTYWMDDRVTVDVPLHFSTGGSTEKNRGWNFIELGYRF